MYRKILATAVTMFLLMTSLAYAANMQVNSSAVPVSGGTIAPNGIKFFGPLTTDAQRTYVVTPKAGWTLTNVTLDGADLPVPYVVPFDTSKIHTLKANFAQTLSTFSLTATAGAGGTAIITGGGATGIQAGSARSVVVGPNTGYQIASVLVDGVADPAAAGLKTAYTVNFTNIQASHTVVATFSAIPVQINVSAGGNRTVGGTPAFSTTLSGSASVTPTTIQWNLVSGPAGAAFGTPTALSTTFTGTALGSYVVSLTVNGTTSPTATITVNDQAQLGCTSCHAGSVVTNFNASGHKNNAHGPQTCYACHVGANTAHPGTPSGCAGCHGPTVIHSAVANAGAVGTSCNVCHTTTAVSPDAHAKEDGCIDCHAVALNAGAGYVQDNNGVRSIVPEFGKTSHHVVGKTLSNSDCAVCHLEGRATPYGVHTDATYHMADNKIHLRNCNTSIQSSAAEYTWDPANPDHTAMDQFCMSCHNANGATAVPAALFTLLGNGASATNPFGDAIRNDYDMMSRSVVTPVYDQFDTGNSTHHAVRGQKYSGRTRAQAEANYPGAFTQYSGAAIGARNSGADTNSNAGIGPMSPGSRYTLYEAGYFVSNYTPLGASKTVGDDSTLHCGDCHTVGQWKPGSTTAVTANADGTSNLVTGLAAIGAHGSANEYMLRASDGADAVHHQTEIGTPTGNNTDQMRGGTYVCFLCHKQGVYGSEEYLPFAANRAGGANTPGASGGHGGQHPCNEAANGESTGLVGSARVASHEDGEWGGGNLFGYTCAHCHNAGNKGFGGIHGGNAVWGTYSASQGYASASHTTPTVTYRKSYRLMGGLSLRYNGGATAAKWESQVLQKSNREGCYNFAVDGTTPRPNPAGGTLAYTGTSARSNLSAAKNEWVFGTVAAPTSEFTDGANATQTFGTWGACSHHNGTSTAGAGNNASRKVQRPLQY